MLTCFIVCLHINSFAQRKIVAGFFPDWISGNTLNNELNRLQYSKLTDVFFAFTYPQTNGTLTTTTANSANVVLKPLSDRCRAAGVKIHISVGGANHSSNFTTAVSTLANRTNFINSAATMIKTYNLDGINVDWEFPAASDANNLAQLMVELKQRLNRLEDTLKRELELTAAVAPLLWNTDGINQTFIDNCDYIYIMSFDAQGNCCVCGGTQHASFDVAQLSLQKWSSQGIPSNRATCGGNRIGKNVPGNKLVLGIPFYSKNTGYLAYNSYSASNPRLFFEDEDGFVNNIDGQSKPLIERKVKMVMEDFQGAGVWTWELTQDRNDEFSLLSVMHTSMQKYVCDLPKPNLGNDVSICGQSSITLNSGIATPSVGTTFRWYRNNTLITNASNATLNITQAGTYKVEYANSSCAQSDEMLVANTLPDPILPATAKLCETPTITLNSGVVGNGINFTWTRNNATIIGANSANLVVNQAGTYIVNVSALGCANKSAQTAVSTDLVEASSTTACPTLAATLTVSSSGNDFEWFTQATGGNPISTGKTYTANVNNNTTSFWVQRANTTQTFTLGKTSLSTGWQDNITFYGQKLTLLKNATLTGLSLNTSVAGNVEIEILNASGNSVATQQVAVVQGAQAIILNISLNAGTYFITAKNAPAGTLQFDSQASNADFSISSTAILDKQAYTSWSSPKYSGVASGYGFFYNVKLSTGSGNNCARTEVKVPYEFTCQVPTSVGENDLNSRKAPYPNPVSNVIYFEGNFEIYDVYGNKFIESINQASVDLLPAGIYILKQGIYSYKIVKE